MRPSVKTNVMIVCLAIIAAGPAVTCAEAPRYRWQPNSQFVYQVRITADTPLETEIMSGHIVYDVVSAGEPLRVKYIGRLEQDHQNEARGGYGPSRRPLGTRSVWPRRREPVRTPRQSVPGPGADHE